MLYRSPILKRKAIPMTELIGRMRDFFQYAKKCAPVIGWKWAIGDRILRRIGINEVRIRVKGLAHRVVSRTGTSDIFEFMHLLGWRQVPFDLPIRPTFIVDAGANVGYSALRFQKEFPGAKIVSLEPEERNARQFKKNCAFYSNISLETAALWPTTTRLRIRALDAGANAYQVEESPIGEISALSIDEIMQRYRLPRIDLLKVDIEGSEKEVFSHPNAKCWLRSVAMILIEIHDDQVAKGCQEAVQGALEDHFDFRGHIDEYAFYVSREIAEGRPFGQTPIKQNSDAADSCIESQDI
jgi:FkbM family methyltransferase